MRDQVRAILHELSRRRTEIILGNQVGRPVTGPPVLHEDRYRRPFRKVESASKLDRSCHGHPQSSNP